MSERPTERLERAENAGIPARSERDAEGRFAPSAWLGKITFSVSSPLQALQLSVGRGATILRQGGKRVFGALDVRLRLAHFLYRMRWPCHARFLGTILLLLEPVQYELGPYARQDKATTLRQKLVLWLVKDGLYRKRRLSSLLPLPTLKIDASDDGTFGRWMARRESPNVVWAQLIVP